MSTVYMGGNDFLVKCLTNLSWARWWSFYLSTRGTQLTTWVIEPYMCAQLNHGQGDSRSRIIHCNAMHCIVPAQKIEFLKKGLTIEARNEYRGLIWDLHFCHLLFTKKSQVSVSFEKLVQVLALRCLSAFKLRWMFLNLQFFLQTTPN